VRGPQSGGRRGVQRIATYTATALENGDAPFGRDRAVLPGQIATHPLDPALALAELDHRVLVGVGERAHLPPRTATDPVDHRRRRDPETMQDQERRQPARDPQISSRSRSDLSGSRWPSQRAQPESHLPYLLLWPSPDHGYLSR
jgi:hypothetical protein